MTAMRDYKPRRRRALLDSGATFGALALAVAMLWAMNDSALVWAVVTLVAYLAGVERGRRAML